MYGSITSLEPIRYSHRLLRTASIKGPIREIPGKEVFSQELTTSYHEGLEYDA